MNSSSIVPKKVYVFPYTKIKPQSKVIIYGAGKIGSEYEQQVRAIGYCEIVSYVDTFVANDDCQFENIVTIGIRPLSQILQMEYDYIVVAVEHYSQPIMTMLSDMGIAAQKIINDVSFFETNFEINDTPNIKAKWNGYYAGAEQSAKSEFEKWILPAIKKYSFNLERVLDFPSGKGRIAAVFQELSGKITCCDANQEAIYHCKERFSAANAKFEFAVNEVNGHTTSLLPFSDNSFTFIYSWDAMVHFSYKWIDFYLSEFYRILEKGGYIFIHHSNLADTNATFKSELFSMNTGWRSLVSADDINYLSSRHNLAVREQKIIDWGQHPSLDCISILQK